MRWTLLLVFWFPLALHAEDWPRFRGPTGQGISQEKGLPTKWSATENIAWKVDVPGHGWSSPVVQKGKVYLTTATNDGKSCRLLCYEANTGKRIYDQEVFQQVVKRIQKRNSPATPTPIIEGEVIYLAYHDGTLAAVKIEDGKPIWINRDFPYFSEHGLAASPIIYKDLLIMPFDGSSEGPDKQVGWIKPWDKALIVALEKTTGKLKWKATRNLSRIAHATPLIVTIDGQDRMISVAGDVIQGFDLQSGERLWSLPAEGEGLVPSPIYGEGLVFCTPGFGKPVLRAVRLTKDKTPEIAWENNKFVSMMPSMLYSDGRLFVLTEKGNIACLQAKTGTVLWEDRLSGAFCASPVLADGHIYCISESGETFVFKNSATFELVSRNPLKEETQASPAMSDDKIFLRTKSKLWCVK